MCEICIRTCNAIGELNAQEGCGVNILAANRDFVGAPYAVEITADWTNFQCVRYEGDSTVEALELALKAKRNSMPINPSIEG